MTEDDNIRKRHHSGCQLRKRRVTAMTAVGNYPDSQLSPAPALTHGEAPRPGGDTADEAAIGQLWQLHGATLHRFALKLTFGDHHRAEDIVQETFLRAWYYPEIVGTGRAPIRGWLFTVTRRIAIDMWRARSRSAAAEESLEDRHAEIADPVQAIERAVDAVDVQAALDRLTPEQREVITEIYVRGHSVGETADILGIPEGTVKSRSYYAMRLLRQTTER
jgi:RNA polymerase sigma-70 factor, ECF subfamily